jgi:tetratricopeptide (TPR) repeat protein
MFRNQGYILLFCFVFTFIFSCSPKINKYESLLDGISVRPEILSLHKDSVRVNIRGALPLTLLNKDTKVYLYPEYRYGEGALRLGEFTAFDGVYMQPAQELRLDEKITFPYLEGMDTGTLALKALVFQKDRVFTPEVKELAVGVNASVLLTRMGQITPNEPIQELGIYITTDFSGFSTDRIREFAVNFGRGGSEGPGRSLPNELYNFLNRGERGYVITKIKLTGLISPEDAELVNPALASQRAENLAKRIKSLSVAKSIPLETSFRINDWFDFRLLLRDYEGITSAQKEAYYSIITSNDNFSNQLSEMRALPTFRKVSSELFPKLRTAKVEVVLENSRFSDPEIAASVYKMLQEGSGLEGFSKEHLIYAGQEAKRLQEKERIYAKLVEIHPSVIAFNNLGVVYLNQANRALDTREKNILINNAVIQFREANRIQTNSISMHNMGRALILRGDMFEAYIAISEASAMEKDESNVFLRANEGLRGALDILNGDYRLATIRFNRAPENEVNFFNKGLAYFLAEDYRQALIAFEESIQFNRDYGYGFYGLALVAAVSGDEQGLVENLAKAVERSEFLKEKALKEILFSQYRGDRDFIRIFR